MNEAAWLRVVQHLLRAELQATHPQLYSRVKLADIPSSLPLKDGPLAIDSLTLVGLATAVAGQFNLFESGTEDTLLGQRTPLQWAKIIQKSSPTKIVFRTSGTSGEPKSIEHSLAMLSSEATFWAESLPASINRIVAIAPAHHIYGFIWTTLVSNAYEQVHGKSLLIVDIAIEDLNAAALTPGDLIVTVPSVWDYIAQTAMPLPQGCVGISSTAPMNPESARVLRARADLDALFEIYGSSETSAVGFRYACGPYELLPQLQRSATDSNEIVRAGEADNNQYHRLALQDQLEWTADRQFLPIKRKDDVIQIGGHNVSPQWVAEQIAQMPDVTDCAVRSFTHQGKAALKVFLILKDDCEDNRHKTIWTLREQLPAQAMPKSFAFGVALPRSETGKLTDWPLPV
jgi:long-chain acyl-CoA synthetase